MASFMEASDWAHANLDKVTYKHSLAMHSRETTTIRFVDIFEHRGQKVGHECLMHGRRHSLESKPHQAIEVGTLTAGDFTSS